MSERAVKLPALRYQAIQRYLRLCSRALLHVKCRFWGAGGSRSHPRPPNPASGGPVTRTRRTDLWPESERESEICAAAVEDVRDTQAHFRHFFSTSTEEQLPYMVKVSQARTQSQHTHARTRISLFFSRERTGWGAVVISCVQEHIVLQLWHTAPEVPSAFACPLAASLCR